jgi:hypothetical protein
MLDNKVWGINLKMAKREEVKKNVIQEGKIIVINR